MISYGKTGNIRTQGAKGLNLSIMNDRGLKVPPFFVLSDAAFFSCLSEEERLAWQEMGADQRYLLVDKIEISGTKLQAALKSSLAESGMATTKLAVRSSSRDEDGRGLSYAGQFLSVLNVEKENLEEAVCQVWRSAFMPQVIQYRRLNGIDAPPEPPCVIVQQMVPALLAGVAFGADPVDGSLDVVTISSITGLADKLVSGEQNAATYKIRAGVVEKRINEGAGALTDEQLLAIENLVKRANEIFESPQDIEWAIDEFNQLYILQSRPITTLTARKTVKESVRIDIFDNSNIGESYPGITTPLTFSFARKAYQHVYENFCRLMGVPEKSIEKHSYIFPQMLGFVRGRIYYNLLNWYRLLSLFPGFKTNRKFMEQMMGVKSELPEEAMAEFNTSAPAAERIQDAFAMGLSIAGLLWQWCNLPSKISKFNRRTDRSLSRVPKKLDDMSADELGRLYRSMEQDLLANWDAPIVNDFFAMVSFGILRSMCNKWLPAQAGIHNQLLCGETGIISTEPLARLKELAEIASKQAELLTLLNHSDSENVVRRLSEYPEFKNLYDSYIETFGDRCTGELKLESPTVGDAPAALFKAIARIASSPRVKDVRAEENRRSAEQAALSGLGANWLRLTAFNLTLKETRTRIRERENLRFMRTRVFGAVRKIFVAIGRRFEELGILNEKSDIFYLETEEVLRFLEGTCSSCSLKETAELRKREFEGYKDGPAQSDRLIVRGGLNLHLSVESGDQVEDRALDSACERLQGLGCCPGKVRAPARVIDDPNRQSLNAGEILVAKRTDPGWITVIAQASAIVVEYGSLLSHTAIVARELGIPTIVSVSNVTSSVKTGDWLDINGATGEVLVEYQTQRSAANFTIDNTTANTEEENMTMRSEVQSKAGFQFVRYAQCWEDSDIVLEAMQIKPGDNCLSIASAGDNTLAILSRNPGKVVALDLNPAQLALLELKAAAFKHLTYRQMLVVLGYRKGLDRLELFEELYPHLSAPAQSYWKAHVGDIEFGVASCGRFERYFETFRNRVLPLVHSKLTVDALLAPKSPSERERFYKEHWNTLSWRALFHVFFSETVMGCLGRDPSFFQYAEGGLSSQLLLWTKKALVTQDPAKNPYLHWILKGEFGSVLPTFLQEENFEVIKANIEKLEWHQLSIEEYLSSYQAGSNMFDCFNLSDVFEYISEDNYKAVMKLIAESSKEGAQVVYWNMMAPRTSKRAGLAELGFATLDEVADRLFERNKTFFYTRFVVEKLTSQRFQTKPIKVRQGRAA